MNSLYLIAAGVFMSNEFVPLLGSVTYKLYRNQNYLTYRGVYKNVLRLHDRDAISID